MTAPKVGDRVHVEFDGTVWQTTASELGVLLDGAERCALIPANATVEILPPPEPEYQIGGWYTNGFGGLWEYLGGVRWLALRGRFYKTGEIVEDGATEDTGRPVFGPARPLVRLVPEGTP